MAWLRAKTCVFFLFSLITFGQAYPYSYAWAQGRHAECGCNDSGRKCIHGCDLKKKAKSPVGEQAHAGHEGPVHDHAAMGQGHQGHDSSKPVALETKEEQDCPFWVSPDCSKQKQREVLDFRGDPFVPQVALFFLPTQAVDFEREVPQRPTQRAILPDPPPPKHG